MLCHQAEQYLSFTRSKVAIAIEYWDDIFGDEFKNQNKREILAALLANITYAYESAARININETASGLFAAEAISGILNDKSIANSTRITKAKYLDRYRNHPGVKRNAEESIKVVSAFIALAANAKNGPSGEASTDFIEVIIGYIFYLFSCDSLNETQAERVEIYLGRISGSFGLGADFAEEVTREREKNGDRTLRTQVERKIQSENQQQYSKKETSTAPTDEAKKARRVSSKRVSLLARKSNVAFMSSIVGFLWFAIGLGLPAYYAWTQTEVRPLGALALVPLISFGSSAVLNGFRVLGIGLIAVASYIGHLCLPDPNEWVMSAAIGFIAVLFVTKVSPEIQNDISKELENLDQ